MAAALLGFELSQLSTDHGPSELMAGHLTALAFDYGTKKIGVAVGQSITQTASPLAIIPARDGIPDWAQLKN